MDPAFSSSASRRAFSTQSKALRETTKLSSSKQARGMDV